MVAHYVDRHHPWVKQALFEASVLDLNVHTEPIDFLRQMQTCEFVVSSSLHGLIFAESLGIPNVWIKISDRIAGDDFKFYDWFSLARHPQRMPAQPTGSIHAIGRRAMLHQVEIDREALKAAFPSAVRTTKVKARLPVSSCRRKSIPIFVISYNRGEYLQRVINSYRHVSPDSDIIIHDFGSDDPLTLGILDALQSERIMVTRDTKIKTAGELNRVSETVQSYFSHWAEPSRYVATDCDIDMSTARSDVLHVYDELLDRFPRAEAVGPMLRINDIPQSYPLYHKVMNRHIEQFWHKEPIFIESRGFLIAYIEAKIDTTFAMHRANQPFKRLRDGIRVYEPFEARHLDWYLTPDAINTNPYTETSSPSISHWATRYALEKDSGEELKYSEYIVVEAGDAGNLLRRRVNLRG